MTLTCFQTRGVVYLMYMTETDVYVMGESILDVCVVKHSRRNFTQRDECHLNVFVKQNLGARELFAIYICLQTYAELLLSVRGMINERFYTSYAAQNVREVGYMRTRDN